MNVAASSVTNVAIMAAVMRKRMIQHFDKAGALSAETAIPLPLKHPRSTVNALIKHKVIVSAGEGPFYLISRLTRVRCASRARPPWLSGGCWC